MALFEDFHRAQEKAQERAAEAARDAQEMLRDAQEFALELARARAHEASEHARRATETLPPGLITRITSSLVGIPLLVFLVFAQSPPWGGAWPFTAAVTLCALLGGWEYFKGLRLRGFRPSEGMAFLAIAILQFAAWKNSRGQLSGLLPALFAILVIATLIQQVMRRDPEPIANIGVTFLGVVYVGWLFSYLIFLRSLPGDIRVPFFGFHVWQTAWGAWAVLYVFAVTWSTDAGAYFTGIRWGKRQLSPRLSPKKTVEGAIGGLIAAGLMSLAWGTWIGIAWHHCILLGALLGVLAQVGDLCESAIKRDLGIKDFGSLLPGHGGILDRFDSLLFTAPVAYYYLVWVAKL